MLEWALPIADGLIAGSVVLLAGIVASLMIREPVYRLRLLEVTLFSTAVAFVLALSPAVPRWSLPQEWLSTDGGQAGAESSAHTTDAVFLSSTDLSRDGLTTDESTSIVDSSRHVPEDRKPDDRPSSSAAPQAQALSIRALLDDLLAQIGLTIHDAGVYLGQAVLAAWFAGVAAVLSWLTVGIVLLGSIIREGNNADSRIRRLLDEITGRADHRLRAIVSRKTQQPVACRVGGRVIVLPESFVGAATERQLRFAIAHEWSHIDRGDWWVWLMANLVRAAFFFHPGAWWARRQVRLCQDFIADARAAGDSGSRLDYAEFLTERAHIARRPVLAVGLGMRGRKSELFNRVLLLVRQPQPLQTCCSRRRTAGLLVTGLLLAAFCGSGEIVGQRLAARTGSEITDGFGGNAELSAESAGANPAKSSDVVIPKSLVPAETMQVKPDGHESPLCCQLAAFGRIEAERIVWFKPDGTALSEENRLPPGLTSGDAMLQKATHSPGPSHVFLVHCWRPREIHVEFEIVGSESCLLHEEQIQMGTRALTTAVLGAHWQSPPDSATIRLGYDTNGGRTDLKHDRRTEVARATQHWVDLKPITIAGAASSAAEPASTSGTFEGRTFSEWQAESRRRLTTRKQLQVIQGLTATGGGERSDETAASILNTLGDSGFQNLQHGGSSIGQLQSQSLEALLTLPPSSVVGALVTRLVSQPAADSSLAARYLLAASQRPRLVRRLRIEVLRAAPSLLLSTQDDSPTTRALMLSALLAVIPTHPDVLATTRELAACEGESALMIVLRSAVDAAPKARWLIDRLIDVSLSGTPNEQTEADRLLVHAVQGGAAAAPVVNHLIDLLAYSTRRATALNLLCELGPAAASAVPTLITEFQRTENFNRVLIVDALTAIGPHARAAVPVLQQFIRNTAAQSGFDALSGESALQHGLRNERWGDPEFTDRDLAVRCANAIRVLRAIQN